MAEPRVEPTRGLIVEASHPLVAVPLEEDGREVVRYLVEAAESDQPDSVTQEALGVIGAWDNLDWDGMEAAVYRIRHDAPPTPPNSNLCRVPGLKLHLLPALR